MEKSALTGIVISNHVFDNYYIDSKSLFLSTFHCLPNRQLIQNIDGRRAHKEFEQRFAGDIVDRHSYKFSENPKRAASFYRQLYIMERAIVEFGLNYCEILHSADQEFHVPLWTESFSKFRERRKQKPQELSLVVQSGNYMELRDLEIKRTVLNLDLYYDDDLAVKHELILSRLRKRNDKGLVLLHGLPGTGKTTYLRYLIRSLKKRVIFLPVDLARNLSNPSMLEVLIENPNSVLVIEDAEHLLLDRRLTDGAAVSGLLNLTDGLLADCLNMQVICTFNSSLASIDSALLRKGRLIARHEFGRLPVAKAQRLSDHFGFTRIITQSMTVADIVGQAEMEQVTERVPIGFRTAATFEQN